MIIMYLEKIIPSQLPKEKNSEDNRSTSLSPQNSPLPSDNSMHTRNLERLHFSSSK